MFAYCVNCGYDSGDEKVLRKLEQKIKKDGGQLKKEKSICPKCTAVNTLVVEGV